MFKAIFATAAIMGCATAVRLNDAPVAATEVAPVMDTTVVADADAATHEMVVPSADEAAEFVAEHAGNIEALKDGFMNAMMELNLPEEFAPVGEELLALYEEHAEVVDAAILEFAEVIKGGDDAQIKEMMKALVVHVKGIFNLLTPES